MTDPVICQFVGGPWDGEVRQMPERHQTIEVSLLPPRRTVGNLDDTVEVRAGCYHLQHTPVGMPWQYRWQEPA